MRIIAGKYKNKKIVTTLKGISPTIKPTTSKVREAAFSIILNYLEHNNQNVQHCSFLDLCCGTGAIGIEAISRGFASVYFVDQDRDCIALTKHNLSNISNKDFYVVIRSDITKLQISSLKYFDVIYLDPPYSKEVTESMLSYVSKFAHPQSLIVVETSKKFPAISVNNCRIIGHKSYNHCTILVLVKI